MGTNQICFNICPGNTAIWPTFEDKNHHFPIPQHNMSHTFLPELEIGRFICKVLYIHLLRLNILGHELTGN